MKDEESLKKMTAQAKVLVNCCGPYRFYGEPVIKACIATHTHQVDVSGEPQVIFSKCFKIIKVNNLILILLVTCAIYFYIVYPFIFVLQYIESIQLKYNKAAEEAGIYIISACGFDSIPCDLGIIFTQQKFNGEVNSIETYLNTWVTTKVSGALIHYGTYESAIYGIANFHELRELRSKLYPERLPQFWPKLKPRLTIK